MLARLLSPRFARAAGAVGAASFYAVASSNAEPAAKGCRPIVLCGPSGAGKSTLITRLRKEFPEAYGFSVSHTTRGPRPGERHAEDYYFVDKADMEAAIKEGKFLEHAFVHGNFYGTSFAAVESVCKENRVCILDIDIQGVKSCRAAGFDVDAYIFIAPPDLEILEQRLRGRGTETEERILKRLSAASGEIRAAQELPWDAWIVNDDIEAAYKALREATAAGRGACMVARKAAGQPV